MILTVTLNPALDKTVYIDSLQLGGVNKFENSMVDPGGKGINVSKVLKNFNNKTVIMSLMGGYNGEIIKNSIQELGIELCCTPITSNTRMNIKLIDIHTGLTTDLNDQGVIVLERELNKFICQFQGLVHKEDFVVLSGSAPIGVPNDIYCTLADLAAQKGAKVFVDTSGELLKEVLKTKSFLIKPNIEELEEALGIKLDTYEKVLNECKKLLQEQVSYICLSMGSEGAILMGEGFILKAQVPRVNVKSTVGAGDSLLGGMLSGLDKGYSMDEAFKTGIAASVAAVTKEGTKAPSLQDLNSVIDKIQIIKEEYK